MNNIVEIKINCSKNLYNMHYYYLGVLLYQLFYFSHNLPNLSNIFPWPRIYFKERMVSFFEGQMFDSRQCLMSILTCMQNSNLEIDNKNQLQAASCANYIEFNDYIYDPNTNKIIGIKAFDKVEKKELNIYSEVVVNCTGIYADSNLNKEDKLANKLITTSKGSHMVVKKDIFNTIGISDGYMIPKTSDGRVLFILPYQKDYFLIGTTDTEMEKSTTPFVTDIDYSYLLKELTLDPGLSEENLKKAITSKWAGYRPLVLNHTSSGKIKTKSIARNHVIRNDPETGLITLMGGKWTTYRRMGEDVIHEIIKSNCKISDKAHINSKNINLNKIKLTGGYHQENLTNNEYSYNNERSFYAKLEAYLIKKYNIETKIAENLIFKYGMNSIKILEINQKISENDKYIVDKRILTAELYYSIRNELTIKPNDFLCRRTGLSFVDTEIASQALGKIIEIMGKELKWNKEKRNNEKLESGDNIKYMI